jgi:hypothetical protein
MKVFLVNGNPTKVDVWPHLNGQGEENTWMSGPTGRKIHTHYTGTDLMFIRAFLSMRT